MDQIQSLVPNHNSQEIDEPKCKELTSRVMAHYSEYYETKSRIACDNVFLLISPTWLSSLELSFLGCRVQAIPRVPACNRLGFGPDQGASTENASDCGGNKGERKGTGQIVGTDSGGCGGATHDGVGEAGGDGRRTGSRETEVADGGIGGKCRYAEKQDGGEGYGDFELCSGGQVIGCCCSASAQNSSVGDSERC